jgi:hypothetical protein
VVLSHTNSCIYISRLLAQPILQHTSYSSAASKQTNRNAQRAPVCVYPPPPLLAQLSMAEYDNSPISTDTNCHVQSLARRPGCPVMFLFSLRTCECHTSFCPRPYYHVDSSPSLRLLQDEMQSMKCRTSRSMSLQMAILAKNLKSD